MGLGYGCIGEVWVNSEWVGGSNKLKLKAKTRGTKILTSIASSSSLGFGDRGYVYVFESCLYPFYIYLFYIPVKLVMIKK